MMLGYLDVNYSELEFFLSLSLFVSLSLFLNDLNVVYTLKVRIFPVFPSVMG